jgi:hypothetical protein
MSINILDIVAIYAILISAMKKSPVFIDGTS